MQAPEDEIAKFDTGNKERDTLLAMGKRMDDAMGRMIATLKSEGVWENTLIFYFAWANRGLSFMEVWIPLAR